MERECLRGRRENTSNPCYSHSDEELTDTASSPDSSGLGSRVTPKEISAGRGSPDLLLGAGLLIPPDRPTAGLFFHLFETMNSIRLRDG